MKQHTPTPWVTYTQGYTSTISPDLGRFCLATLESDGHADDAAFIVRAVNSHDRLIEACKKALTCASLNSDARALIVTALQAAEAETTTTHEFKPSSLSARCAIEGCGGKREAWYHT